MVEPSEVEDDLVRDMTEVLTSLGARLYGRRSARTRAHRALRCKEELSLSERTYRCPSCGLVLARNLNAAIILAEWAHPAITASAAETLTACGADRKPGPRPAGGREPGTGIAPAQRGEDSAVIASLRSAQICWLWSSPLRQRWAGRPPSIRAQFAPERLGSESTCGWPPMAALAQLPRLSLPGCGN